MKPINPYYNHYATIPKDDLLYGATTTWINGLNISDDFREEVKKIVKNELDDTSNKMLILNKNGIPKWSNQSKETSNRVNPVVEEHTVKVNTEKSKEDINVKKFLKKAFIVVFVSIGIFSTINYITNDRLVPIVCKGIEEFTDKASSFWITLYGNGRYHGRNWNSYSPEYKKKVFDALTFKNKQELIEFLKSGVNEEVEAFRNNIK